MFYIKIIIDDIVAPPPWQPSDIDFGKIFNFDSRWTW